MNVFPTLDGGLRLEIEDDSDWQVLMAISFDAERDLASDLSELMDEESMWEDLVMPDLKSHFSSQLEHVLKAVRTLKKVTPEGEIGELHISREDADTWYGALNQARLALEEAHQFGPAEDVKIIDLPDRQRQGYFRDRFYCHLQSLLIEYVMD